MEKLSESAGGVIVNSHGQVVVVNQRRDSWSLPKGHIDPGEDALTAAKREIAEESGITELEYVRELGSYERYKIARGGDGEDMSELKRIHMFLFRSEIEALAPTDPGNPEARWVPIEEVTELLTHPKDKQFFDSIKGSLK
jgi:8-oxo-dGTP pyrophosphatase MutT (NUDIX family)